MLMTLFNFSVEKEEVGVSVTLTQLADQKVKHFVVKAGNVEGLTRHMKTLTDDQCSSFFQQARPKKEKVKETASLTESLALKNFQGAEKVKRS